MRSEIPQIEVITAIADSDCEDYVAQLLYSQGWSIIYRAFDFESLSTFLQERSPILRTVIIFKSDLPGFDGPALEEFNSATTNSISLDGVPIQAHELMSCIRSQLRLPLIVSGSGAQSSASTLPSKPSPMIISVTGTSGAPGRSTISINLASYLSFEGAVKLIDADIRAPSLEYLAGDKKQFNKNLEIIQLQTETKPIEFPEFTSSSGVPSPVVIVDLGALPPVEEFVSDRRWQAGVINKFLEETSTLIYVAKSDGLSLIRLEGFISQLHVIPRQPKIIYLLNQMGRSRADRALENRFNTIVQDRISFKLPSDFAIWESFSTPQKRSSAFTKEIARISQATK